MFVCLFFRWLLCGIAAFTWLPPAMSNFFLFNILTASDSVWTSLKQLEVSSSCMTTCLSVRLLYVKGRYYAENMHIIVACVKGIQRCYQSVSSETVKLCWDFVIASVFLHTPKMTSWKHSTTASPSQVSSCMETSALLFYCIVTKITVVESKFRAWRGKTSALR